MRWLKECQLTAAGLFNVGGYYINNTTRLWRGVRGRNNNRVREHRGPNKNSEPEGEPSRDILLPMGLFNRGSPSGRRWCWTLNLDWLWFSVASVLDAYIELGPLGCHTNKSSVCVCVSSKLL